MDKKFIKSMVTAIAGLGLISSCSNLMGKDSHKCAGHNGCKGKTAEDSHKCAGNKKEESNTCGAKNGCAAAKEVKSSKKPVKKSN